MATLNGIVRFSGQVGDLIFYRRGKKDVVRGKSSTHQLSENSKKSATDFGEASKHAAYIRKAFAPLVRDYGYGDLISRFTKTMVAVFKTIPAENTGRKKLLDANLKLLAGFEFNVAVGLNRLLLRMPMLRRKPEVAIELVFPEMELKQLIKVVPKADAFKLQLMVFNFDLNDGAYEILQVNDLQMPIDLIHFPGAKLIIPIDQQGERAVLLALGISYMHDRDRKQDRRYYACQIIEAMHLRDGVEVEFVEPVQEKSVPVVESQAGLSWEVG